MGPGAPYVTPSAFPPDSGPLLWYTLEKPAMEAFYESSDTFLLDLPGLCLLFWVLSVLVRRVLKKIREDLELEMLIKQ